MGHRWQRQLATIAVAGVAGAGASSAEAQAPRQVIAYTLAEQAAGAPSAASLSIDYINPDDPEAKPYAVATLDERLPAGARFDTSVPGLCKASDAQLISAGAAACPADSKVGGGELDVDTGFPGPQRIVRSKVTLLNNQDQLILLVEQEAGSRVVSRGSIENETVRLSAPPLPGGPPDGYSAITRVEVQLDRIVREGRGYITAPPTCPAGGRWTSSIDFTYRDGVKQTATSESACHATPGPPAPGSREDRRPDIKVRGLSNGDCVRRRVRVRVAVRDADGVALVVARLNGRKLVAHRSARRFSLRINRCRLSGGNQRLKILAIDRDGNRARKTITFTRCARSR